MNKTKFTIGLIVAIIGIISIASSIFFGINNIGGLYREIKVFSINFPKETDVLKTEQLEFESGQLSLWLKMPNRQIENKEFTFSVSLISDRQEKLANFQEDFNFGYFRQSSGQAQYYKLGEYSVEKPFSGYLSYQTTGSWEPPHSGQLALRQRTKNSLFSSEQIVSFIAGLFLTIVGFNITAKSKKAAEALDKK